MAIQIIPNLEAQKAGIERQRRDEAIGQLLQLPGEYQKSQKTSEAYRKMGIPEEVRYLPEEAQKEYFKKQFAGGISDKDTAMAEYYRAKTGKLQEEDPSKEFFKQLMEEGETPLEVVEEEQEEIPEPKGILKPGEKLKKVKSSALPKPQKKAFNPKDVSTWKNDQLRKASSLKKSKDESTRAIALMAESELQFREDEKKKKLEEKKIERSAFESDRAYHTKISDPIIAEADAVLQSAPIKRGLMNQMRVDVSSGNTSGLIPFLVEKTGAEAWRNPESARFKTIAKEQFIESLNSIGGGARPNQFIEQQLSSAQPSLGRDPESNQTVLDLLEFKDDLIEQRAKLIRDLAKKDREELGYVKNDVAQRADDMMSDYAEKRQEQMAYDIRRRKEQNMSDEDLTADIVLGKVTPGTPLTIRAARILMIKNNDDEKKAMAEAKKYGFIIPSETTYMRGMK